MELLKDKEFKGLFFEILKVEKDNWHDEYMYVIVRASNHNDKKKKIALDVHYISSKKRFTRWNGIHKKFWLRSLFATEFICGY
jgi:hypothetical protein